MKHTIFIYTRGQHPIPEQLRSRAMELAHKQGWRGDELPPNWLDKSFEGSPVRMEWDDES